MQLETRKKFARIITDLRGSQSYREFGRKIGISHPTVKAWENLEVIPDTDSLRKIAQLRGETLEEFEVFLGGTREFSLVQRLVQQIHVISKAELAIVLRAVAERLEGKKEGE
ncbi:MAG: helix-turn-helix transcriptional regulator [Oscillatoriaceae cyanobacterium Prado104]|jgi:transcriptional regulator with XRE-family HTH domain|nr:helix-turn-helix transcriptional regulator [Oscillatoriaceae cyanobacterium Prado104]